jgi:glycosyltransferase involved in cell wall biosynthesis
MIKFETITISVIIPTYNRAEYLNELLKCLINQSFKNFEVLVCDDGSLDNTKEIVASFNEKLNIRYFYQENCGGPAKPRNLGIKNAVGDWLCFVDSDDLWTDNKLEVLARNILRNNNLIYCHPVYLINESDQNLGVIGKYKKGFFLNDFRSLLYNGSQVINSSLCIKRSILTSEFYYNTDQNYHAIEDYIFILNFTHAGYKIKPISETLGYYRIHSNNLSADLSKQIKKWKIYFSNKPFNNINHQKIESLSLYIQANANNGSNTDKAMSYFNIVFKTKSTFEIKLKSLFKLILHLFNL